MKKRAAVVIGVDKPKKLTPLKAAASSAKGVAHWLDTEGFDVQLLTDEGGENVTAEQVTQAVKKFVKIPIKYHLLLVYFSGHGYWHSRTDIWLLSQAPETTHEAVNLTGAIALAKYSGIQNVVFVSDACRTVPDARTGNMVRGIDAFPNLEEITTQSKIDYFKATSEAQSAWEGPVDGKVRSVLTHAWRAAYSEPTPDMVHEVNEGGRTIRVVPNRRLEDYLQDKVDATLAGIRPDLVQVLDTNVPSKDDVYIARVSARRPTRMGPPPARDLDSAGVQRRDARRAVTRDLSLQEIARTNDASTVRVSDPATERAVEARLPDPAVDHFETQCGFSIRGARVEKAAWTTDRPAHELEILDHGDPNGQPAILRIPGDLPFATVVARLNDGRGVVLPFVAGYIGHATIDERGLSNVSYVPSSNSHRFGAYTGRRRHLDRLRALVAVAVDHGVFRVQSDGEAVAFADRIRVQKSLDPTLGLYAAHAYWQAGKDRHIRSVRDHMRSDIEVDLFDLQVLTTRSRSHDRSFPRVPFCPVLTQTWNLLRPRGFELPPVLDRASDYLSNALWTTFEPEGANLVLDAIQRGELT